MTITPITKKAIVLIDIWLSFEFKVRCFVHKVSGKSTEKLYTLYEQRS